MNAINKNKKHAGITKQSPIETKKRVGYSMFKAKVKMDKEDDFRKCPFGFIYK